MEGLGLRRMCVSAAHRQHGVLLRGVATAGGPPDYTSSRPRFRDSLPEAVDVVCIGGGVIGVCSALYLRRMGCSVAVFEKGRIAGEQSSRNWGWVRCMNRDPAELPLAMEAQRLWKEIDADIGGAAGFRQSGISYLCSTEEKMENWHFWLDIAKAHGLDSYFLSSKQIEELVPSLGKKYVGALHTPTDGRAEPWDAVPAIARLAHDEGVIIREDCAVRGLDINGRNVNGVVTEENGGTKVKAEQVVLCGGAWSSLFARRHGVIMPQLLVRGTVVSTEPMPAAFSGQIKDEDIAMRRREDGGYTLALPNTHHFVGPDSFRHFSKYLPLMSTLPDVTLRPPPPFHHPNSWSASEALSTWEDDSISPFEKTRVLNPPPDLKTVERLRKLFSERFPGSAELPQVSFAWAGMIDAFPDVVPIVDRAPNLEQLILATGMSAHGFGIGPAFGKAVANIALGKDVGHDMFRFRADRFDGTSRIVPGPGL